MTGQDLISESIATILLKQGKITLNDKYDMPLTIEKEDIKCFDGQGFMVGFDIEIGQDSQGYTCLFIRYTSIKENRYIDVDFDFNTLTIE